MSKNAKTLDYYDNISRMIRFDSQGNPVWMKHRNSRARQGMVAGSINNCGYRMIGSTLGGKTRHVSAARLHWYMATGQFPRVIDHINRVKSDNRIENLRDTTHSGNTRNVKRTDGSSKYKGVSYSASTSNWKAEIRIDMKGHYLGIFDCEEDAARAYDAAAWRLNVAEFTVLNFPVEVAAGRGKIRLAKTIMPKQKGQ